jgi:membrane-associated protease RseP (regulator of RpoE activity)
MPVRRKFTNTHIALFVLTFLSTLLAGALQKGIDLIQEPMRLWEGLPFSLTLMIILLSHELSHYFASRAHRTEATLPYFIPAPSIIGTFGAFIKMKSPIATRKALIDIGASGPIVGFVFSVFASIVGLEFSEVIAAPEEEGMLGLGNSLLFSFLARTIVGATPEGYDILLHPIAFAGWIGLFVTTLNLIPIGQLDGGHIAFALFGRLHRKVSMVLVATLAMMGIIYWGGWMIWAVLMFILGLGHPPVLYWESPLDPNRKGVGWLALFIFVITFIPVPFTISF